MTVAGEYLPPLREILDTRGAREAVIDSEEMASVITHSSEILNLLGIRLVIPRELKKLALPSLALRVGFQGPGKIRSYLSLGEMLDFSWEVVVGDKSMTPDEFRALAESARGIVKFRDQYLLMSPEEIRGILEKLNRPVPEPSTAEIIHWGLTGERNGIFFHPDKALQKALDDLGKGKDLIVTTYGVLRRDLDKFKARSWGMVVIDEAQNIKNPQTDQAKAVKAVRADVRVALSGTPVENRLFELWSIFDFLNPGYLGNARRFQLNYAVPIERYRDRESVESLRRVTSPFLLRRLKTDKAIINDLPDKVIFDEYCYLTREQAALYQQVVEDAMERIEESEGMGRRGLVLKLMLSLKQVCNHPRLYTKKGASAKELSRKAAKMVDILEKITEAKEKALVFTQYREMGSLLLEIIARELGEEALFFHGQVPRAKRDRMVEQFQEHDDHRFMVISLKAGGTGLNLTAASNVIHYDLWWNPAVEDQATDRTYRIGQKSNVMVHRLICLNTFEEKIDEMMREKRELADLTVTAGEKWITELSNRELREIFTLS